MKKRNQIKTFLYLQFVFFGLISFVLTLAKPISLLAQSSTPREIPSKKTNTLESTTTADSKLAALPQNLPLRIPLGSNSPIPSGIGNNSYIDRERIAIGYISHTGSVNLITARDLRLLFAEQIRYGKRLSVNDDVKLSSSIPVINLLVEDKMGRRVIIYGVNLNSFVRDCLNATFNGTL